MKTSNMKKKILIIDDSPAFRESLRIILKNSYDVTTYDAFDRIDEILTDSDAELFILGSNSHYPSKILDLKKIHFHVQGKPIVLMFEDEPRVISQIPSFINNEVIPRDAKSILNILDLVEKMLLRNVHQINYHSDDNGKALDNEFNLLSLIDNRLTDTLMQLAGNTVPVFIGGETGTPKEIIARIIHDNSPLRSKTFLKISERDLSEKGLYERLVSSLRQANILAGTIYIEELSYLQYAVQGKLVSLIDGIIEDELKSYGIDSIKTMVIGSSRNELRTILKEGKLSDEFYYKISSIPFFIPPLRERASEIKKIAEEIALQTTYTYSLPLKSFTSDAIKLMETYLWPGNLDELKSVIVRSIVFSKENIIDVDDIKFFFGSRELNFVSSIFEKNNSLVKEEVESSEEPDFKSIENDIRHNDIIMNLAHEIKNPLVGIKTFASLLPHKYSDEEFRNDFYHIVTADINRIDSLVERIIEFKNASLGFEERCNINELIKEVAEESGEIITEKNLSLEVKLGDGAPTVIGLRNAFKYALDNLIRVVAEDCKRGGKLRVTARRYNANGEGSMVEVQLLGEMEQDKPIENSLKMDGTAFLLAKRAIERYDTAVIRHNEEKEGYSGFILKLKQITDPLLGE